MSDALRPGRPRSAAADQAIVDAALAVFAEEGFDGLTMEAVAARAGVGKATVYRRYPGKAELVIRAASCLSAAQAPEVDTGTLRGDLQAIARNLVHLLTATVAGRCVPELVSALPRCAELADEHGRFIAARRRHTLRAVERAVARGEIHADADAELIADVLAGPIFYRHLVLRGRLDVRYADRVADAVIAGLARPVTAHAGPAVLA
jgi:AcrR family transcriptional regulator